jgi:acetyl-CoA carboxylase biotin carboxyl carrier protein
MPEKRAGATEPFSVERIHYFVRLMKRYDLTALDLVDGPVRIRLRRRAPFAASPALGHSPEAIEPAHPSRVTSAAAMSARAEPPRESVVAQKESETVLIKSPMVGTFYTSNAPDAPPFVTAGSVVHPETVVCIIEAMKVFTDIPAAVSGKIIEVMAKNGQPVEYGQALFRVAPA